MPAVNEHFDMSQNFDKYTVTYQYWHTSIKMFVCLTLEVTNDNFHGVHRLELYIVAFLKKSLHR